MVRSGVATLLMAAALVAAAVAVVVAGSSPAGAAPSYHLLTVDAQGAPLSGSTASVSASEDASVVAFAQAGASCAASTVFVRHRAANPPATEAIASGLLPSVSADGSKVAYEACSDGAATEIDVWNGTTSAAVTAGQWRTGGVDTIKDIAIAPTGTYVAFSAGAGTGPATTLWLAKADGSQVVPVAAPTGAISSPSTSDTAVAFVAGTTAYRAPFATPAAPTPLTDKADAVSAVSVSRSGQTVAFADGAGVSIAIGGAKPVAVTAGASEPALSGDGTTVAVTMSNGSIATFTAAALAAPLITAAPIGGGGFSAPVTSDQGRQVIFLAKPGSAAGGSSTDTQAFADGPGLSTADTDFGAVGVGSTATKPVTFTNDGTVTVTPTSITSSNPSEFAVTANGTTCAVNKAIPIGTSCVVQVTVTPSAAGARTASLAIVQQEAAWDFASATSTLTATGVNGALAASPTALDFGSVTVGTSSPVRSFTVTNSGSLPTTIGTLLLSGGQASEFPLAGGTCAGSTLAPAATCTVSLFFKPGGTGTRQASLDVGGSGGAEVSVALTGTGTIPPQPALAASPSSLAFGEAVVGSLSAGQTVTVRNSGNVSNSADVRVGGTNAGDFQLSSNGCTGHSLAVASSCSVTVLFEPTAAGSRTATLTASGSGGSSASVKLSGTGRLNPTIAVSPGVVVPGQVVAVTGDNFEPDSPVTLGWDGGGATMATTADAGGNIAVTAVVPGGLGNGARAIVVITPADAASATATVLLQPAAQGYQGAATPAFDNSPAHPQP